MRTIKRWNWFDVVNVIVLSLFALSVFYPFYNLLLISLSVPVDAMTRKLMLIPQNLTLGSYKLAFLGNENVLTGYYNTLFRTVIGTLLSITTTLCAAYALSQKKLPLRGTITIYFLINMFFSGGMIPSYLLIRELGLIDSRWALILPGLLSVFNLVVMRNYIQSAIDKSLEESAAIDGANPIYILFKIIVPLCKPVIATISLWTIVGHWNAWFDALIYINDPNKQVLQIMLRKIIFSTSYDQANFDITKVVLGIDKNSANLETLQAAFIFIVITPILILFPFLQRYFVKGIMIGALKG